MRIGCRRTHRTMREQGSRGHGYKLHAPAPSPDHRLLRRSSCRRSRRGGRRSGCHASRCHVAVRGSASTLVSLRAAVRSVRRTGSICRLGCARSRRRAFAGPLVPGSRGHNGAAGRIGRRVHSAGRTRSQWSGRIVWRARGCTRSTRIRDARGSRISVRGVRSRRRRGTVACSRSGRIWSGGLRHHCACKCCASGQSNQPERVHWNALHRYLGAGRIPL
jgi:hypothetical protein